nr:conotoxin precursor Cerm06 [Conus ebraeus]
MKVVVVLLASLAVVAYASPQKRFFIKDINNLLNQLKQTINNAKNQFDQITAGLGVNFDAVVDMLIDQIDSDTTQAACRTICVTGATEILQQAAPLANQVCEPACKAALAKMEEIAG